MRRTRQQNRYPPPAAAKKGLIGCHPPKPIIAEKAPPTTDTSPGSPGEVPAVNGSGPQVSRIRTWTADTYTRIVIDVGSPVKYQAARISGPDRIYFDIEGAKISPEMLHSQIDGEHGGLLKTVRIARNHSEVVRVVLEVDRVKDYSVFLLPDPYRLVVDLYGTSSAAEAAALATSPVAGPTTADVAPAKSEKPAKNAAAKAISKPLEQTAPKYAADSSGKTASGRTEAAPVLAASSAPQLTDTPVPPSDEEVAPPVVRTTKIKKSGQETKSAHDLAEEMGPPPTPELTRDGQHSLTRALGLKIGRIVIDAGHGGHDTGTIGPTGLMEKDLCLDVSLRVGKLIEQRLPGAEVVYTREDDTFIPLEQRTEIANDAKADLFLSVHANSSQDHQARGIETYYLNFTGSSDAMEVASRENALSENSGPRSAGHREQDCAQRENRGVPRFRRNYPGLARQARGRTQSRRPQSRRAQGSVCGSDRRQHAFGAGRDFLYFQSF